MDKASEAILRTLAFMASQKHAPTISEFWQSLDTGGFGLDGSDVERALHECIKAGIVAESHGRLSLAEYEKQIDEARDMEIFFPRKLRRAIRVAKYIKSLPYVRAVCLCNTMALGQTREDGDLDFFIICKAGTIWQTRLFATLPFALLKLRPGKAERDPVCLSFFVSEKALDLDMLAIRPDDPYLRYWLLNILPLYDDGVLEDLWQANKQFLKNHQFAKKWLAFCRAPMPGEDMAVNSGNVTEQGKMGSFELFCKKIQLKKFSEQIKARINTDSSVVVSDDILKFHITDRRREFYGEYKMICGKYGVDHQT